MISSSAGPRSVAIENVVFVEFRAPTKVIAGRWDHLHKAAAELTAAVSSYNETIMQTRELLGQLREMVKPGVFQMTEGADPAVALLLGPGSEDLSQAQHRA